MIHQYSGEVSIKNRDEVVASVTNVELGYLFALLEDQILKDLVKMASESGTITIGQQVQLELAVE